MIDYRKTMTAALAVTALSLGIVAPPTPVAAWGYYWGNHGGLHSADSRVEPSNDAAYGYRYNDTFYGYRSSACGKPDLDFYGNVIGYRGATSCF